MEQILGQVMDLHQREMMMLERVEEILRMLEAWLSREERE